ncbi:MAG: ABC transporter permease [Verrucomicrobiota bacterium]|nr:ABC transporter permease [Verrucomicrobiota bacterium]
MIADLRYTIRQLIKNPGFAAVAILTLALGIGANTAIFTVVNGVLLRPLSYPQPERLVTFQSNQSAPELDDVREQSRSFASVGGVGAQAADYTGGAEPVQIELGLTSGDFFQVLKARAQLGRTFDAGKNGNVPISLQRWELLGQADDVPE